MNKYFQRKCYNLSVKTVNTNKLIYLTGEIETLWIGAHMNSLCISLTHTKVYIFRFDSKIIKRK